MNTALCLIALSLSGALQRGPDRAPALGAPAPAIIVETLDSKSNFDLASNKGKRPTVLLFGSCT